MKTYRLIVATAILSSVMTHPVLAQEQSHQRTVKLIEAAFPSGKNPMTDVTALKPLEMEETKAEFAAGTFNGFDWYLGERRNALRPINAGGRCLSCSSKNIYSF